MWAVLFEFASEVTVAILADERRHELGSHVSLRIIGEIAEWIGAEASLGYDIAGSIAVNARNNLPSANKASRNLVAAFTANAGEEQNANNETSRCDTACAGARHLTRHKNSDCKTCKAINAGNGWMANT